MTEPTRAQYMGGQVSHHEYYLAIARESGLSFRESRNFPKIVKAIKAGDDHLNSIGLAFWDALAFVGRRYVEPVARAHGDYWSISVGVCALKAIARHEAREFIASEGENNAST